MKFFMRYVISRAEEMRRERTYRIYVTDVLRSFVNEGTPRYADLFKPQDVRTPEEIISGIRKKLGG